MRMYGTIGPKVDGDYFAKELSSLDAAGLEMIHIRVNSPGGDVFQGMSIVSALLSMDTPITVHIDGIAASMAAVIAVAADTVCMMDYAKMMIHDPYFVDSDRESLNAKQRKMIARLTDMLRQVLIRRGMDEATMEKLMKEETWFSAQEALSVGLCDEITSSARNEYMGLNPMQLVDAVNAEYQTSNHKPMEKVSLTAEAIVALGITGDQLDNAAISAAILSTLAAKKKEIADLKSEKERVEAKLDEIMKAQESAVAAEAATFAEQLVKSGKISADAKDAVIETYKSNPENARKMFESIPERTKLSSMVGRSDSSRLASMSWEELDKAGLLADLKANDPDLYAEKYKEMSSSLRIGR